MDISDVGTVIRFVGKAVRFLIHGTKVMILLAG